MWCGCNGKHQHPWSKLVQQNIANWTHQTFFSFRVFKLLVDPVHSYLWAPSLATIYEGWTHWLTQNTNLLSFWWNDVEKGQITTTINNWVSNIESAQFPQRVMHGDPIHKQRICINKQCWVYAVRVPIGFRLIIPTWANMAVESVILEKLGRVTVYIFVLLENKYSVHALAACAIIHWGRVTHAYMCPKIIPSLVQIMACRLVGANGLSEPML